MSKYALDKALWLGVRGEQGETDLTDEERRAFEDCDVRALYSLGAIPFLVYSYAMTRAGGVSLEAIGAYVAELEGLEPVDTST